MEGLEDKENLTEMLDEEFNFMNGMSGFSR
jgi:hypothetical protein